MYASLTENAHAISKLFHLLIQRRFIFRFGSHIIERVAKQSKKLMVGNQSKSSISSIKMISCNFAVLQ